MDPRDKLKALQEQKSKLKSRIEQIGGLQSKSQVEDTGLERLLLKKKALQEERRQAMEYRKLEKEYEERRRQMEREKELLRVQNEKRVLELEAAMKRVVVEGMKQKIKGMNSQQLMMRGFLRDGEEVLDTDGGIQDKNFKEAFEGYLLDEGPEKLKQKYDVKKLNQQRLAYFQRKQEVIMRQILLKQLAALPDPIELDVMALNRHQLQEQLEQRGIDFEEFMHPVNRQEIIENYPNIKRMVQMRIEQKRKEIQTDKQQPLRIQRMRKALRQQVSKLPYKDVEVVRRLLYDFFDQICDDYEKRHVPLTAQDQQMRAENLQRQYQQVCGQMLVDELSQEMVEDMLEGVRQEMLKEAAEEIAKLHQYAHQKTEQCFKSVFGEGGDVFQHIHDLDKYKFPLVFVSEEENKVGRPKEEKYLKKPDNDYGIYQTEEGTTNLVNDIALLDAEQRFMEKVTSLKKNQTQFKTEDTLFYYDRELYAINRHAVRSVHAGKVYFTMVPPLESVTSVVKIHRNWLLQSESQLLLLTAWGRENYGNQLGGRISNPCGVITYSSFYPVTTFLGNPCSAILGFEKGQILKFNFNRNRISGRQTNLTHYMPAIEHAKSGDQPAFPLDNRNYLPVEQDKPKPTDEVHQYRQFMEHHSQPVIFVGFYRIDRLISVDRSLKCALWEYSKVRGVASYEPVFKFQIKSTYQIFTQDQNPRYKDIYPTSSSKQTPQEMYQKYMLTQAFLRLQLYNNPKKEIAYFKSPTWQNSQEEKPIWKITYKDSKGQVSKILQSYYNVNDGKIIAQQAHLQGETLYVLCQRDHIIRSDLKTIKLYSWGISEKRLGRVGVEIDMFKDQKVSNFIILLNQFKGSEVEMALIVNSGRLLLFSLVSGQLLKNINEQLNVQGKEGQLYFKSIVRAQDRSLLYGISSTGVMELTWEDNNSINERNKLNKAIDAAKRKFFR